MNFTDSHKLDNPVWHSLSETHNKFVIDHNGIKFYNPEYCSFGGVGGNYTAEAINEYAELTNNFFIVGEKPDLPNGLQIKNEVICLQMVIDKPIDTSISNEIVLLTPSHTEALYQLVNLVQPGYFMMKTALMGNYYGIFEKGVLIAVTGERMQMDAFVEISAVITHPDHTGKGYAKQLVAHAVNTVFKQKKIPYLHVVKSNIGAIKLYEKLGFITKREISFWNIVK
ncbi:GNAT family N-acetyltransferase [Flavobacterium cerinum]|uniref:GNAT family N-acetyltransferase n=1 Tax=Flavobacterium cerinum TaxID=2502784 RepID=A0A444H8T2_9FLAO|nr:GNAT family N-acetyltransferase [Flavobacterium cerinum]RWW99597.1 GNAT family N-acetyltransferase [Flavobacterium cerinum]